MCGVDFRAPISTPLQSLACRHRPISIDHACLSLLPALMTRPYYVVPTYSQVWRSSCILYWYDLLMSWNSWPHIKASCAFLVAGCINVATLPISLSLHTARSVCSDKDTKHKGDCTNSLACLKTLHPRWPTIRSWGPCLYGGLHYLPLPSTPLFDHLLKSALLAPVSLEKILHFMLIWSLDVLKLFTTKTFALAIAHTNAQDEQVTMSTKSLHLHLELPSRFMVYGISARMAPINEASPRHQMFQLWWDWRRICTLCLLEYHETTEWGFLISNNVGACIMFASHACMHYCMQSAIPHACNLVVFFLIQLFTQRWN